MHDNFGGPVPCLRFPAAELATLVDLFSFSPDTAASGSATRVLSEESDCDERGEFHPVARSNARIEPVCGNNTVCH